MKDSRTSNFQDLDDSVVPVFPLERSITIKGHSIRRKQVPMCPAFSLTDYKVQGSTLTTAILDLKVDRGAKQSRTGTGKGYESHKKYCSTYVQLSRLRSLQGLYLLQNINMDDLRFRPHPQLLAENERLRELEQRTLSQWLAN